MRARGATVFTILMGQPGQPDAQGGCALLLVRAALGQVHRVERPGDYRALVGLPAEGAYDSLVGDRAKARGTCLHFCDSSLFYAL